MIIIDADACPSINLIENKAKEYQMKVLLCCDMNHQLNSEYSEIKYISPGRDSVDNYIANIVKENDIVITQDYGVATTALGKKAYAIGPKGLIYTDMNIDNLMYMRHLNKKIRNNKVKIKGPKKRTKEDDVNLLNNLELLIVKALNK